MLASPLQSDNLSDCAFSQTNSTYARRDPKKTLLYQIVDANYEEFMDFIARLINGGGYLWNIMIGSLD
ncbi:MAG: hypothetical protein JKY67_06820 [Pseudomonadales bacterium]|nr:hypothetical protein [Pseudomonadales bacterium]